MKHYFWMILLCSFVMLTWCSEQWTNSIRESNYNTASTTNNIEEVVLWKWAYRWMTLDEVKNLYSLNKRNIKEWFNDYEKTIIDDSKFRVIDFSWEKWIEYTFWFYKYDGAFRLYSTEMRYIYSELDFQNMQKFLERNFWDSIEKTMYLCFDCKEWYKYNKSNTTAYIQTQYEYLWSDNISNIILVYKSDKIGDLINSYENSQD